MKFKLCLFVTVATITLVVLPSTIHAQTPQSCLVGEEYLDAGFNEDAVDSFSTCLISQSHSMTSKASAYYNRAKAYYILYSNEYADQNIKKGDKFLVKAFIDIDNSIELDPSGNAKAYCLRGHIQVEKSKGLYGYEDWDKGIAMGAPKHLCEW